MTEPLYEHGNFADLIGYRLTAWRAHEAEIALEVDARHMNRSDRLLGGVLARWNPDYVCAFV
jgi:acyl-coenzyme A thioesterase PaaI-like protein